MVEKKKSFGRAKKKYLILGFSAMALIGTLIPVMVIVTKSPEKIEYNFYISGKGGKEKTIIVYKTAEKNKYTTDFKKAYTKNQITMIFPKELIIKEKIYQKKDKSFTTEPKKAFGYKKETIPEPTVDLYFIPAGKNNQGEDVYKLVNKKPKNNPKHLKKTKVKGYKFGKDSWTLDETKANDYHEEVIPDPKKGDFFYTDTQKKIITNDVKKVKGYKKIIKKLKASGINLSSLKPKNKGDYIYVDGKKIFATKK